MDPPTPGVPRPAKAQAAQKKKKVTGFVRRLAGLPACSLPLSGVLPTFGPGALPLLNALRSIHPRIFRKSWKGFLLISFFFSSQPHDFELFSFRHHE